MIFGLFVDGVSAQALAIWLIHLTPPPQIIISGVKAIGEIEQFAQIDDYLGVLSSLYFYEKMGRILVLFPNRFGTDW